MRHVVSYLAFCLAVGAVLAAFVPMLLPWYAAIAVVGGLLMLADLARGRGPGRPRERSSQMFEDSAARKVAEMERASAEAALAKRDRRWDVPHPKPPTNMVLKAADGRTKFGLNGCQVLNLLIILGNSSPERWWELLRAHAEAEGNPKLRDVQQLVQRAGERGLAARGGFTREDVLDAQRMAYETATKLRPLIIDQVVAHLGGPRASAEETFGEGLRDLTAMMATLVVLGPWFEPGEFELLWGPYESALPVAALA